MKTFLNFKRIRSSYLLLGIILLLSVLISPSLVRSAAGVPMLINFQGRLMDNTGELLGTAGGTDYCYKFSIWNATSGGSKIWPSGAPSRDTITTRLGVFDATIGEADTLDLTFTDDQAFVEVEVATMVGPDCTDTGGAESFETLAPRPQIVSSGFAINSKTVGGFTPAQSATNSQIPVLTSGAIILGHATTAGLTSSGANPLAVDAGTSGVLNLNNTSSGNILLGGGSGSTGCTVTNSTGAFACTAGITGSNLSGTNTGDQTWNGINAPTGTQTLTFDDGELNAWTVSSDTETFHTITANSLTTGKILDISSTSLTTGNLVSLASTSTALASGNNLLNLAMSGANGSSGITATGLKISVTNTGTTSTNVGLEVSASGGTTNTAITATGKVNIASPSITLGNLNWKDSAWASTSSSNAGLTINNGMEQTGISAFGLNTYTGSGTTTILNASGNIEFAAATGKGFIFNPGGLNSDFIVKGDTDASLLFSDASADSVGISTSGPGKKLEINSTGGDNLRLTYNDSDGSAINYADLLTTSAGALTIQPSGFIANIGGGATRTALRFLEPSGTGTDYAAIQSNANVTTSYTWTLPAADASGCIQSNGSGTLSISACDGTIAWNSLVDPTGTQTLTFDDGELNAWTVNSNTETFHTITANSLTTGKIISLASSSVTSGTLLDLSSSSTATTTGQKGLNIGFTGSVTGAQTTYGGYISNQRIGGSNVNVGLYVDAGGGTSNYALVVPAAGGNVGIGDATPAALFTVGSGDLFQVNSSGAITAVAGITNTGVQSTTVSSATALTVAKAGTDYSLQVDTSTASAVTGLKIKPAAAAAGIALSAISTGTDEFMTIDAKGAGEVRIGGISTGSILFAGGSASTGCTITTAGALTCSGAGSFSNLSGTNTGDQTSIVGITGTTAEFNTALSDNDFATLAGTETLSGKTLTTPKFADLGYIADANGNELIILDTVASAVNEWTLANGSTGVNPKLTASGEANVGLDFQVKGTGVYRLLSTASGPTDLRWFEDTDNGSNYVSVIGPASTSDAVLTLQGTTGTIYSSGGTDVAVADGGTNCSAASITCFNNITGFTAAGATGTTSTNLVFSTSPTLVTPVLGAATYTTLSGGAITNSSLTATRVTFAGTAGLMSDDAGFTFTTASDQLQLGVAGTDGSLKIFSEDGATDHSTIFNPGIQTQDIVYTLPVNDGDASQVLTTDGAGVLSWTTASGGTTWNGISAPTGTQSLTFDDGELNAWTVNSNTETFHTITANSLTTGKIFSLASSSLTSGTLIDLAITGTAGATGQKGINVSLSGNNASGSQTTYAGYFSNTHGGSGTNVGLYTTATTGTTNLALNVDGGQVLIGGTTLSTSTEAKLNIVSSMASNGSTTAIAGIHGEYTINPTGGGTQVGNRFVMNNAPTSSANTSINQIVRTIDNTSLANTVRGIEIVSSAGSNTAGTNTGIRSTGATFGGQFITTGLAGGVSLPAAIYAENTGTTQGDVARFYTGSMTSAPAMLQVYHDTSTFTGAALLMDMAVSTGTFSGNFLDLKNASVQKFKVTSAGVVSMGLSGTASTNAVCSSLANATAPTAGTAYEIRDCNAAPAADYAEMYPVENEVEFGDIVVTGDQMVNTYDVTDGNIDWTKLKGQITKLKKSTQAYQKNVVGIVSDNFGDFTSAGHNIKDSDNPMPIALNGRVPVKVSTSSEPILAGDYLTTSFEEGKATKATKSGIVIGKALESWNVESGEETVMVYIEQGYYNGQGLSEFAGLDMLTDGEDEAKIILAKFLEDQTNNEEQNLNISEILTDRIAAGLEVITPKLVASIVNTGTLNVTDDAVFSGLAFFGGTPELPGKVTFDSEVEFNLPPIFNKDTAGFALVKAGDRSVRVEFEEPYIMTPIVTASISFEATDNIDETTAENLFAENITSLVIDKDETGFTILLNKPAPQNIRFSWIALGVKDAQIFESLGDGLEITDKQNQPDQESQSGNSASDSSSESSSAPEEEISETSTVETETSPEVVEPEISSEPTPEQEPESEPSPEPEPSPTETP